MRLGIVYNFFEGSELLEASIREIRDCVDYVLVNYQKRSYFNQPAKQEDLDRLAAIQKSGLIDGVIDFNPETLWGYANTAYQAKQLERMKRENGRIALMNYGKCTHFISMDSDEFYRKDEFIKAKKLIEEKDIWFSACMIKEYVKSPAFQLEKFEDIYVPFIIKMGFHLTYERGKGDFMVPTDPTRWYNSVGYSSYKFRPEELVMHHMNNIRKNLVWKYQVTSRANLDKKNIPELVQSILMVREDSIFKNRKIVKVPDYFKIGELIK